VVRRPAVPPTHRTSGAGDPKNKYFLFFIFSFFLMKFILGSKNYVYFIGNYGLGRLKEANRERKKFFYFFLFFSFFFIFIFIFYFVHKEKGVV
jgi:hypothetical protein